MQRKYKMTISAAECLLPLLALNLGAPIATAWKLADGFKCKKHIFVLFRSGGTTSSFSAFSASSSQFFRRTQIPRTLLSLSHARSARVVGPTRGTVFTGFLPVGRHGSGSEAPNYLDTGNNKGAFLKLTRSRSSGSGSWERVGAWH